VAAVFTLARKFIYGPGIDEPICMIDVSDSNKKYYYHFDGLGSVVALSDSSANIIERYSYDVFGEPNTTSTVGNPYMFTGRRLDTETHLYYYRARYYAYDIGRFLQTDPIGYRDGMNIYTYCVNNPLGCLDPSGFASVAIYDPADKGSGGKYATGQQFKAVANKYDYSIAASSPEAALIEIKAIKDSGVEIDDLYVFDHGGSGFQTIGNKAIVSNSELWIDMANVVEPDGSIHLRGCGVANLDQGQAYLQDLANSGKKHVDAYAGNVTYGKGWFKGVYFSTSTLWEATPGKGCPSVKKQGYSFTEWLIGAKN